MQFLKIALNRFYRLWSAPGTLSLFVISPLLLVLILGAGFYERFSPRQETDILRVAYLPGNSVLHSGFEVMLTQIPPELMTLSRVYFRSDGLRMLDRGQADCFLEIRGKTTIVLHHDRFSALQAAQLESILESFLDYFRLTAIGGKTGFSLEYSPRMTDTISYVQLAKTRKTGSLEFFCFMLLIVSVSASAIVFASGFISLRRQGIFERITSTGQSSLKVWLGCSAGNMLSVFTQILLLLGISFLSLKVWFGPGLWSVFPAACILAGTAFLMSGLGTLIFTVIRSPYIAWPVLGAAVLLISLPLPAAFPKPFAIAGFGPASVLSPLWWTLKGLYESASGNGFYYFGGSVIICCSAGILLLAAAALVLVRRKTL